MVAAAQQMTRPWKQPLHSVEMLVAVFVLATLPATSAPGKGHGGSPQIRTRPCRHELGSASAEPGAGRYWSGSLGTLTLACAEFFPATVPNVDPLLGEVASDIEEPSHEPFAARLHRGRHLACNDCLIRPHGTNATQEQLLDAHIAACARYPGVLYEVVADQTASGDAELIPTRRRVFLCARAGCSIAKVIECAVVGRFRSARLRRAWYWDALTALVPWQSTNALDPDFARAPGVPPYRSFRCAGPDLLKMDGIPTVLQPWPQPRRCGSITFHPISFGIPEEDVVTCLPEKMNDFASLVPGQPATYVFPMTSFGELEYKRMYREARFALCPKKQGWETMRLYEILASGAVPLIRDIHLAPAGALSLCDKDLLSQALSLPGVDVAQRQIDESSFQMQAYKDLAEALLRHTRERLTTKAIARYVLNAAGKQSASRILYVANCLHGDYQCYLMLHGLRSLMGERLVDFPKLPYMYRPAGHPSMEEFDRMTTCPQSQCCVVSGSSPTAIIRGLGAPVPVYGGGFSYGFRLEDLSSVNRSAKVIAQQVRERVFDAVVFGSAAGLEEQDEVRSSGARSRRRHLNLWELVAQYYDPSDVIIIDGRDPPPPSSGKVLFESPPRLAARGHPYFLREIPDSACEVASGEAAISA
eukprot:TRINITY_DN21485_c1_g1_i1.p1 TRINITY_DN21485_c1_g1~~TRINITY_DN21485_c1_g1_i1.p1  ORF type:complete len:669 (+),score=102.43 TRINITY_DN21485_c1_g1_i1:78-2009(+)